MSLNSTIIITQVLLICGAAIAWQSSKRRPVRFLVLSSGATLIAYAVSGLLVVRSEKRYDRSLYESMSEQQTVSQSVASIRPISFATRDRWDGLEKRDRSPDVRDDGLQTLHEDAVDLFINSTGFGFSRMGGVHRRLESLINFDESASALLQPGPPAPSNWSSGAQGSVSRVLHDESINDFVNRRGSVPNQLTHVSEPKGRWKVHRLELVGLLVHDEPAVYVSKSLPRMNKTRNLPTRPLDEFEQYGLQILRNGKDLFTSEDLHGIRLLGAIRSTQKCIGCHEGTEGELLGAFSYELRPAGPGADLLGDSP